MSVKCPSCQFENPDDTLFCGKCGTRLPSPEKPAVTETLETPKEELIRGTILYEMATGKVPFEGDTPFTIGMKHKGEMPQNPKELNAQISDDLNRVILRCLEKKRKKVSECR
jgi:serine/threonine protein kinase